MKLHQLNDTDYMVESGKTYVFFHNCTPLVLIDESGTAYKRKDKVPNKKHDDVAAYMLNAYAHLVTDWYDEKTRTPFLIAPKEFDAL